ncbi:hypothetical protein CC2G_009051 [Coprinopsis cinerea AmutBmut pab1-1]|nr:hypothetical protein CC2G_009051 [Coprinopsis cinerea AmutBmut pab1-1]
MGSPPHSPMNSFGNYSFDPDARENHSTHEPASRRPSLPQIPQPSPVLDETGRRNTTSSGKMRRPRSAGTGAEPSGEQDACYTPYGRGGAGRRLASKISLLGMFKKAQSSDTSEGISSANTTPVKGSASTTTLPLTPNAPSHGRGSPASAFDSSDVIERDHSRNHASSDASGKGLKITPQPKAHLRPSASFLDLDSSAPPSPLPPSRPPLPSAVDLHNAIANHQQKGPRDRSRSNATAISTFSEFDSDCEDDGIHPPTTRNQGSVRRPSGSSLKPNHFYGNASESKSSLVPTPEEGQKATPPSSILRGHRRTASSSQTSPSPARALRFDSVSTPDRIRKEGSLAGSSTNQSPPLKATASSHSLRLANKDDTQGGLSPDPIEQPQAEDTAPALNDKQEPTQSNHRPPDVDVEGKGKDAHQSSEPQPRPRSFGSASRSSLSPVFTNDNTAQSLAALQSDFPFSIHQPPPTENKSPMNRQLQLPEVGRGRGDSLSSTWTSDSSGMPQYSTGGSTINSSPSPVLHTPGNHTIALPTSKKISDDEETYNHIIRSDSGGSESVRQSSPRSNGQITLNERRAHSPLDIDIGAISSHEQAKALVEKTRQDILELASGQDVGLTVSNTGSTPLSAKLAAYGESLALQRRLEEQEKMGQESTPPSADDIISAPARFVGHGVERQLSLDKAGRNHKPRTRGKDPRRPSTADGLSSRGPHNSFFPGEHIRTHQSSMSVSPPGIAQASSTSFDGREFLSSHQRFPASITPSKSLMTVPEPLLSPITPHPIAESDYGSEAPSDFADTETESSPFPSRHTALVSATGLPRNKLPVMARSHNSAKKLNRMGFTVVDQVARPVAQPHSGKLLGGFKSIMQSLKGK